ncbi:MAG: TlpA family protein disulfide reductase [Bacteroidales bacterium]|nr:TlpA family protein disulfide reductase [Bacteroidales bacterium]
MKKSIIFLFSVLILFNSCQLFQKKTKVSGILVNGNEKYIYLLDLSFGNSKPDSILINDKDNFSFTIETEEPKDFILYASQTNFIRFILKPYEKIVISADYNNLLNTYNIEGSEDSKFIKEFNIHLSKSSAIIDSLNIVYRENMNQPGFDTLIIELSKISEEVFNNEREYLITFIENNPNSLASYIALSQSLGRNMSIFNPQTDFEYFEKVDSALSVLYPNSSIVNQLHSFVVKMKTMKEKTEAENKLTGIGAVAPDISLPNPDGDTIRLSSLRGQYVLLDFWAAWCKPCRIENPNLVKNFIKYWRNGFTIYQVSLDKTKEAWLDAIAKDKLTWHHVSDLKYWNSDIAKLYKVQGIPANFLLDKEGKIIAKNLRGPALNKKLEEIFQQQ